MATYTKYNTSSQSGFPSRGETVKVVKHVIDFTDLQDEDGDDITFASGDVLKVIPIPVNTVVLAAGFEVLTATTASGTISVGDAGSATRYTAAVASDATGVKALTVANFPVLYTAADYVQITGGGATLAAGKISVFVVMADVTAQLPATVASL